MGSELQSAASRISSVEMLRFAAAEVEVVLTECALNMFVSIPALWIVYFSHRVMVDEVTRCMVRFND